MLTKVIRKLIANHIEWVVLLLLFPFVVTISPLTSLLMVFILTPFFVRYVKGRRLLPSTPFNLPILGLLIMIIMSLWVTYDILFSFRKVVSLTWGIFLFWSIQHSLKINRKNKFWLASFICLMGFFVSIIALFNPSVSLKMPGGATLFSTISLIPGSVRLQKINPNEIGGVLAWCIPLSYSFALSFFQGNKYKEKVNASVSQFLPSLLTVPLIIMVVVLFFTSSRTAIGSTTLSIALITWLLLKKKGAWFMFALIPAAILLLVTFLTDLSGSTQFFFTAGELLSEEASNLSVGTINRRVEIWSRALYGIQDFPLTGMGMNTFREVVHILYPLFLISPDVDIAHAHNQFLQTALDLGIPGLIFYISIWLISGVLLVKSWRYTDKDPMLAALTAGLAGSMLASFLFGVTDAIALGAIPSFIFWLLLSIISSLYFEVTGQSLDS